MSLENFQPVDMTQVSMADLAPLHSVLDEAMTEKQREFAEVAYVGLLGSGVANAVPRELLGLAACAVMFQVAHVLGGATFYIPKIDQLQRVWRERHISANFNGRNYAQLARKHGLSEMRVRQILDRSLTQ